MGEVKIKLKYLTTNIEINAVKRISVLSGNSGIGKTFIVNAIKSALDTIEFNTISAYIDDKPSKVSIIDINTPDDDLDKILKSSGIIIIDECDVKIADEARVEAINNNEEAHFIMFMRGCPEGFIINPNEYLTLEHTKNSLKLKPIKSRLSEFFKD